MTYRIQRSRSLRILACALALGVWAPSRGEQPDAEQQVADFLRAGEFGLAARVAAQAPNRDPLMRQVAQAQADSGARGPALRTAAGIRNEAGRGQMIDFLGGAPVGGRGGAALADFDSLIDLVTATIQPDTWEEVGGPGAIEPFPGGCLVDTTGVLQKIDTSTADRALSATRQGASPRSGNRDVRATSVLRKVSLNRLERELQLLRAQGIEPDDAMRTLAGIYKVQYVLVYPETGDVVIAGPAGPWNVDPEGRAVNRETRRPTLQLDDLIVLLRNSQRPDPTFGCDITPLRDRLAATQAFLNESAREPLKAHQHKSWLANLRQAMGRQDIQVFGIDPRTRVARVMVEADYRMKLVGMGLEEGVAGVRSYLDAIRLDAQGNAPPMNVLRWWFTVNYGAVRATAERNAFEIRGQGVQVLSENEMLTARGDRVHTGKSDGPTSEFSRSFTRHFESLCEKYPIYAELRNIFDLALVCQLIRSEDLAGQADWQMLYLLDEKRCPVELGVAPRQVDSVINHRMFPKGVIVAGVSGGVRADMRSLVGSSHIDADKYGDLSAERGNSESPAALPPQAWWWD